MDVEETKGTQRISSKQYTEQVAKEAVATANKGVSTTEEEIARKRKEKERDQVIQQSEPQRKVSAAEQPQIDWDAEQARLIQEKDVDEFMELRRQQKMETEPIIPIPNTFDFDYEPTLEEINYMIKHNPEVNKKALELVANVTLNEE